MLRFDSLQRSLRQADPSRTRGVLRLFVARAAVALLALIWCLALSTASVAQAPAPPAASSSSSDPVANSEKKYVLEWMVAGTGAAIAIYLVTRSAHRAEQPKEEMDLILREPMH